MFEPHIYKLDLSGEYPVLYVNSVRQAVFADENLAREVLARVQGEKVQAATTEA